MANRSILLYLIIIATTIVDIDAQTLSSNQTSTTAPEKETHIAPWWVIIFIILCFIHLIGGVVLASLTRYKKYRALQISRLHKRDRIMTTGVIPKEPSVREIVEMHTARDVLEKSVVLEKSGKAPIDTPAVIGSSVGVGGGSIGKIPEGASTKTMSSADTMKGVNSDIVEQAKQATSKQLLINSKKGK